MKHMKKISVALTALAMAFAATSALAKCEKGEVVAKLSHVTGGSTHPKVVASNQLAERVNKEMKPKSRDCMS